jgi:hypothetical protein
MNNLLSAALVYAERGWPVVPLFEPTGTGCSCGGRKCGSVGKHPRTANGLKAASTDPDTLRRWWAKWPDAGVGIVAGPTSGFWMLGPDGPGGLADLKVLEEEHGPLPATARVRSGSGGEHLYFRWPTDGQPLPNRKNHRGLRIDVRGCGSGPGYVVAPPSRNANGPYAWVDERSPADAPAWLLAWVRGTTPKAKASNPRPDAVERAKLYLSKSHPAVSGRNGHGQTFAVARAMVWGFDFPPAVALKLMKELYNPRCEPPWEDADLEHKVNDADRLDFGKPRGYLNVDLHPERGGRNSGDSGDGFPKNGAASFTGRSNGGDSGDEFVRMGSWQSPAPLPEMPPVPPFPVDLFPLKVADYWKACARSLAVPVDYVAVPGMTLLGGAVGRTREVGIKKGYAEGPALWTVVVAPPGSVKSASLKFARAPLARAEADWMAKHRHSLDLFDAEADRHTERVKEWKKGGCQGEPPDRPQRPTLRQITLDSTTTEAAAKVLRDNERGVVVVKDELSGFMKAMNQYRAGGKGDDRQFWLSAWAGAMTKVNRAKDHDAGPLVIPHPFVGIAGMMTPSALPELRGDNRHGEAEQDGFVDRFLFSFPDPVTATGETWDEVEDELKRGYADVFLDLLGTQMVREPEGAGWRTRPYLVPFADDARPVWESFTGRIADRINQFDTFDPFRGVLSKLRGYGARLAILLWSVRKACGELGPNAPLDGETLAKASALIDYFDRHARRCLGVGFADKRCRVAKRLLRWLADHPERKLFNRTQVFQQLKDKRDVTSSDGLAGVFKLLTDHGYVRPMDPTGQGRPGPTPEVYAVNPLWVRGAPG